MAFPVVWAKTFTQLGWNQYHMQANPIISPESPTSRLPRIGGMATMPSRSESLRIALPYILPQVDRHSDRHELIF